MDIQLAPPTVAAVAEMSECARRAFENDGLEHALFPDRSDPQVVSKELLEYRMNRIRKHLQSPDWHYVIATIDSPQGPAKVVGYAAWMAQPPQEKATEEQPGGNTVEIQTDDEYMPKHMDMDAFKYASEIIEKAKKEILEKEDNGVWYLSSLAVDPDFKGKGIASKLVKWGLSKADDAGLPAYLESSPAAVGVYTRMGFKELGKLNIIKNNDSHPLTVMIRTSGGARS